MNKEIKLIVIPLVFVATLGLLIWAFNKNPQSPTEVTSTEQASTLSLKKGLRENGHTIGDPSAKVVVVEFFDPECEACSAFHPVIKEVLKDFQNEVFFQARYMLYHGNSHNAAMALEAAGLQGKYWELHDMLFEKQGEWSHKKESANSYFIQYAKDLKLDIKRFEEDLINENSKNILKVDIAEGESFGVRGTPTFFINGKPLMDLNDNALRDAIVQELKK